MDRELIIRLAQECQLIGFRPHLDGIYQEALERFAALVAAAEREKILEVCKEGLWDAGGIRNHLERHDAIRSRT